MGLFSKSTPPPVPPELPVWLVRSTHDAAENAWAYYRVFRSPRDLAERYGILPWDTLPGVEQTASDFMNRDRRMVEVIGVTAGGKWAEWNLPCSQPPVPGTKPDAPSTPADHRATAVRTSALLVAMQSQDWQLVPRVWDEAGSDENRLEMMQLAVSLAIEELLARQRDLVAFAQELEAMAAEKGADAKKEADALV
jgi:hypothetical protein